MNDDIIFDLLTKASDAAYEAGARHERWVLWTARAYYEDHPEWFDSGLVDYPTRLFTDAMMETTAEDSVALYILGAARKIAAQHPKWFLSEQRRVEQRPSGVHISGSNRKNIDQFGQPVTLRTAADQRQADAALLRADAERAELSAAEHTAKANLFDVWGHTSDAADERASAALAAALAAALHDTASRIERVIP